jgi:hypothetical protein
MCILFSLCYTVKEGQVNQALWTLRCHATRFNLRDPKIGRAKRSTEFAARFFRSSDPVTSHFPDAVLPSACLSPRRHLRSFQLTHPAIRSTNCALTETHRNISPIASTNFSPTGTVCFYACSYALTDMLTTAHVSSHTPAQDTVAHCSTLHPYRDRPQTTTSG